MAPVTIRRISAGGEGVGTMPDGMVVFVPRTAPGDQVDVEIVERRRRYARGRASRIVEPGPGRAQPRCPHYEADRCGGCQLQHLTAEVQGSAKAGLVRDALERIGRRTLAEPPMVPSPRAFRYRAKISLAVRGGRTGFRAFDDPTGVFQLRDCHIASEALTDLWSRILRSGAWPPPGVEGVVLREDRHGGRHVILQGGSAPPDPVSWLRRAVPEDAAVTLWWHPAGGAARAVGGAVSGYPVLAFEQVNPDLAGRIRHEAVESLGAGAGTVVWDLYGGVGDAAQLLAGRGAAVWSVDQDRSATAFGEQQCQVRGLAVTFVAARVEEALHRLPEPDGVLVNPPRAGLDRRVAQRVERWGAERRGGARLCYVSCDPATLARDLTRLPSFEVRSVRAYDLFPQTAHVETLAVLEAA